MFIPGRTWNERDASGSQSSCFGTGLGKSSALYYHRIFYSMKLFEYEWSSPELVIVKLIRSQESIETDMAQQKHKTK